MPNQQPMRFQVWPTMPMNQILVVLSPAQNNFPVLRQKSSNTFKGHIFTNRIKNIYMRVESMVFTETKNLIL